MYSSQGSVYLLATHHLPCSGTLTDKQNKQNHFVFTETYNFFLKDILHSEQKLRFPINPLPSSTPAPLSVISVPQQSAIFVTGDEPKLTYRDHQKFIVDFGATLDATPPVGLDRCA